MNENNIAIEFKNVSKIYELRRKDKAASEAQKKQFFYALKDLSFTIEKGHVVGILGTNGSGKSTLAGVLSGISQHDEGNVLINGEQALVSINVGLNRQLTGLENIELKGAYLGFPKKRVKELIADVIDFAELGDFLYQPVKKYSSGMKSRLGFSINLCLNPDIFIIDEALSVGDNAFSQKCMKKMNELKDTGKTIIFISHSLPQVRSFCDTALWVEGGKLREIGPCGEVCDHYADYVRDFNALSEENKKKETARKFAERVIPDRKVSFFDRIFG